MINKQNCDAIMVVQHQREDSMIEEIMGIEEMSAKIQSVMERKVQPS